MNWKKQKRATLVTVLLLLLIPLKASGQSSSPNYQVEEAQFGTGSELDASSPNYQAQSSTGSLGVGSASSANYNAEAGFLTPSEPFLEMVVSEGTLDLGTMSAGSTASGIMNFRIRSYLSSAYAVITVSYPPTSESGEQIDPMFTPGPSVPGTEQFGMNLVDNSSPNIGSNPTNIPDDTFADGGATAGYNTPNQFKYAPADIIARSAVTPGNQAVGQTNYTVSYIANMSPITPAGVYTMGHALVVVATY